METIVKEEPVIEAPQPVEEVTETAPPGAKTDSAQLLKSLHEEREKRRELERELLERENVPDTGAAFSDEGKLLESKIDRLEAILAAKEDEDRLRVVQTAYPALKDKADEFEAFRNAPENVGMRIETAAKAFVIENELVETDKPRKGLEKETGGGRVPPKTGMTSEEIAELRTTNFREYMKRIKNGAIKM